MVLIWLKPVLDPDVELAVAAIASCTNTSDSALLIAAGDRIEIDADPATLAPRCAVAVRLRRADGTVETINGTAAVETRLETSLLRHGGVIPFILQKTINEQRAA